MVSLWESDLVLPTSDIFTIDWDKLALRILSRWVAVHEFRHKMLKMSPVLGEKRTDRLFFFFFKGAHSLGQLNLSFLKPQNIDFTAAARKM